MILSSCLYLTLYLECLFLCLFVTHLFCRTLQFFSKLWLVWRIVRETSGIPVSTLCSLLSISVSFSEKLCAFVWSQWELVFQELMFGKTNWNLWDTYAFLVREISFKYIFVCSWSVYIEQARCWGRAWTGIFLFSDHGQHYSPWTAIPQMLVGQNGTYFSECSWVSVNHDHAWKKLLSTCLFDRGLVKSSLYRKFNSLNIEIYLNC